MLVTIHNESLFFARDKSPFGCFDCILFSVLATQTLFDQWLLFPGGSHSKASVCNVGDLGSIPGSGRSPGEGNGNPLQYSCLENSMDRGAWWATVHGVAKSWTQLSDGCVMTGHDECQLFSMICPSILQLNQSSLMLKLLCVISFLIFNTILNYLTDLI